MIKTHMSELFHILFLIYYALLHSQEFFILFSWSVGIDINLYLYALSIDLSLPVFVLNKLLEEIHSSMVQCRQLMTTTYQYSKIGGTNFIQLVSPQPVDQFLQTKLHWKAPNEVICTYVRCSCIFVSSDQYVMYHISPEIV